MSAAPGRCALTPNSPVTIASLHLQLFSDGAVSGQKVCCFGRVDSTVPCVRLHFQHTAPACYAVCHLRVACRMHETCHITDQSVTSHTHFSHKLSKSICQVDALRESTCNLRVLIILLSWWWQVVALVTEGAQRPELPAPEDLPGTGAFAGYSEYIMLMEQCWDQDPAARPTFAQVTPLPPPPPFPVKPLSPCSHQCIKEQPYMVHANLLLSCCCVADCQYVKR